MFTFMILALGACVVSIMAGLSGAALDSVALSTRTRSEAVTGTCEAEVSAGSYGGSEPKCAAGWSWRSPRSGRAKAYRDRRGRLICLSENPAAIIKGARKSK